MGNVLVQLLPLMIGAAIVPLWIIILLLLLRSERGLAKGIAFVAGISTVRLVQGILFGFIFGAAESSHTAESSGLIGATLLTLLGILLYITAVKQWQQADDPDGPPPKWMSMMRDLSIVKAFGVGVLLNVIAAKMWVFTLGTVSIIQEAEMGAVTGSFIFLVYILGAELLLLIPLLAYGVAPTQSASTLEAAGNWLEKNNRLIVITVSLIFGTLFLWNGISRLVS